MPDPIPTPCIDSCNFRRRGHCVHCSMTRAQKRLYQGLKKAEQRNAFLAMLQEQQKHLGGYDHWPAAYQRKCLRAGRPFPEQE